MKPSENKRVGHKGAKRGIHIGAAITTRGLGGVSKRSKDRYKHIDELSSLTIKWELVEKYLPDMLIIALSIKARENKLYLAHR